MTATPGSSLNCSTAVRTTSPPLRRDAAEAAARAWAAREDLVFNEHDLDFIRRQAGGHPGLIGAVTHVLAEVMVMQPTAVGQGGAAHAVVRERLALDPGVQAECRMIWADVEREEERQALIDLASGSVPDPAVLYWPRRRHLVVGSDAAPALFCETFAAFVQRLGSGVAPAPSSGLRVDVEAGDVFVDGRKTAPLTELEYKLLLLLHSRTNQIVDKFEIVQAVWGQEYIDTVDDGRIERLVGRLREKLEPDQRNPRFLTTVRGRGYRLIVDSASV